MYLKLYAAVWGLLVIVAAALALTGNFSITTAIVYGFISFGMVFMGMMSVLPSMVSTPEGRAWLCGSALAAEIKDRPLSRDTVGAVHEWLFPTGIEMSRPKHH